MELVIPEAIQPGQHLEEPTSLHVEMIGTSPENSSINIFNIFREQFLKKLQFCSTPFDFNDDSKQVKEKADRQAHLQEFNDYLADQNCMATVIIPHLDLVINMIEKNIFRPLPVLKKASLPGEGVGMEE